MEIFKFNLPVNFLYFLSNRVNLLGFFTTCEEAKSIWKKSKPWKQLSDVLETNSLTLMKVLTFFFWNFSVANMAENRTQCELQNNDLMYFVSFLKHDQGMIRTLMEFQTII